MLPGFRFLFAAIVFSMSVLVFGLGAAALLRAAHEQFASNPAWHAAPEATFAQQADVSRPVLAMLRVEPEQGASDAGPSLAVPSPAEIAPEAARPEPALEGPQQTEAAPAQIDAAAAPDAETKLASIEPAAPEQPSPPANDVTAVTAAPTSEPPAAVEADAAATRIATLAPVAVETLPPAKAAVDAKPDRSAIRRHQRARRAAQRRRLAARARLAAQQMQPLQSAADPFAQNYNQPQPAAKPAAARTR
jgi:hypothetical protein